MFFLILNLYFLNFYILLKKPLVLRIWWPLSYLSILYNEVNIGIIVVNMSMSSLNGSVCGLW